MCVCARVGDNAPFQVCAVSAVRAGERGGLAGMSVDVFRVQQAGVLQDEGFILILRLEETTQED